MNLSKKAKDIAPSITLEITAKAKSLKESGVDVISFGAGEPDFNTPKNIIDAAYKAMLDGKTKYTQTSGILELREAICKKFKEDNDLEYKVDQILVSTGAKQSLANAFLAILNPEDEVIMATPYWVSYPELIKLADGKPVFLNNSKDNGYKLNREELEKALTSKTKAFIINSPNNPTGTIYTKEELYDLAKFAEENNLIIISDEIYEKLIYDNEKHISIASLSPYAYKNTIVINGFSKSSAMTGWRIGYAAANKEIIKLMTSIQSHTTSNTCSVTQYAALEALNGPKDELLKMVKAFEDRKNFMVKLLKGLKDIDIIEPKGAFYVMVDITKYLNDDIKDSLEFSKELLEKEKVAVIPGIGFGLEGYIRLSYAISKEQIEEGIERIKNFLNIIK
ncbi:pyridoxal phosphate-dependent aminotransferase [Clostridium sp. LY3-2]|uniref:pyridoxal phosphate-dependent aminotransferase n=1 Tax=Clostridium sp. LY3-2 TaxID=2942482 RepID=UPI002152CD0F|nr:pyridoxal phosphate-dependent aminotransferase [Clostridium sp. LY3-2]MCR6513607.1 pyridoxal phosphate-dependent aminotransferase [Clostridium sp. LY3-2]